MTEEQMGELLPCPFCGGAKVEPFEAAFAGQGAVWTVFCNDCEGDGPHRPHREQCVKAWNTRPPAAGGAVDIGRNITFSPSDDESGNAVISPEEPTEGGYWTLIAQGDEARQNAVAQVIVDRLNVTRPQATSLTGGEIAHVIYDFLDERFPGGTLPGGVQLFADPGDDIDAGMKHEAGCEALADAILARLSALPGDAK